MTLRFSILVFLTIVLNGCNPLNTLQNEEKTASAEHFIDTFYSFDRQALTTLLSNAQESDAKIVYYQGWAEGGKYKIIKRSPCQLKDPTTVTCDITVQDDPSLALKTGFFVTDTFTIKFQRRDIIAVTTDSDDPAIYYNAYEWVKKNLPELIETPCQGFFDDGKTPGDCARAMTLGFKKFAESKDFPKK